MKTKPKSKVSGQVPLRPEVAAAILRKYIEEISWGGFIFERRLRGKNLHFRVMHASEAEEITDLKKIDLNEAAGYVLIEGENKKHRISLGAFTEISWGPY
ncbi:MAG TPA: hypothetical protein VK254_00305 [Candidatus Bathyarchaeia archaeon]|nr:hypothetical protein [Candidatus Bathyarchaeia archaeon]